MGVFIKRFSTGRRRRERDPKEKWPLPENAEITLEIEDKTEKYQKDIKNHPCKDIIKKLRKDISDGYYYDDRPGDNYDADTHYLKDFSRKDYPNPDKRYLVYTKKISYSDRLYYFIYEPKNLGNNKYSIKIVLASCKGHYAFGRRNYSIMSKIKWWLED